MILRMFNLTGTPCCKDPACSHALIAAASKEAAFLTDKERETILAVLTRDEIIRNNQRQQVLQLKAELQNLRRKGALRASADWDNPGPDPDRSCGRCRVELGRVINRGAYCKACRTKVCKGCREYSFKTTDWVCTVCHKHMEIQAVSGEWMNEFVRRPSRRRDSRVYVPAADIIKRTIRRSWTISNPTPNWNALRGSPELRPYNSLPRGQDINDYPSLALHQTNLRNLEKPTVSPKSLRKHSPARRTHSEDIYAEKTDLNVKENLEKSENCNVSPKKVRVEKSEETIGKRPQRVNPLMRLGEQNKEKSKSAYKRKLQKTESLDKNGKCDVDQVNKDALRKYDHPFSQEKHVSFETKSRMMERKAQSLNEDSRTRQKVQLSTGSRSLPEQPSNHQEITLQPAADLNFAKVETTSVELCDIEPITGTVFRKMTVRRRRQDMRKIPAVDSEGDDYKLVFISSDSSSKEEDIDDNESTSTASSFPIEDCDWDYFEPGTTTRPVINWNSPFGSPHVYRRSIESPIGSPLVYRRTRESDTGTDDDNNIRPDSESPALSDCLFQTKKSVDTTDNIEAIRNENTMEEAREAADQCKHDMPQKIPCQSCGAPTQYIPIPVPVPILFPVPTLWNPQHSVKLYGSPEQSLLSSRMRVMPRGLWQYMSQAALIWPLINTGDYSPLHSVLHNSPCSTGNDPSMLVPPDRNNTIPHNEMNANKNLNSIYPVENVEFERQIKENNPDDNYEPTGHLECENKAYMSSTDSDSDSDSDKPEVHKIYNVNGGESRDSDDALPRSNVTSDCDDDDEDPLSHSSVREDDMSSSGSADTDSDDTGTVADQKPKRFSRIFVVNKNLSSSSSSNDLTSSSNTSDNDTDTELDCTVILTNVKHINDELSEESTENNQSVDINDTLLCNIDNNVNNNKLDNKIDCDKTLSDEVNKSLEKIISKKNKKINKKCDDISSSPGLSDVSAESLNSSDVEQVRSYADEIKVNEQSNSNNNGNISKDGKTEDVSVASETRRCHSSPVASEWNDDSEYRTQDSKEIRSTEPVIEEGESANTRDSCKRAGDLVSGESENCLSRNAARYTSLVMITQEPAPSYQQVNVVTTDTTTLVPDNDVVVRHTNWQKGSKHNSDTQDDNQNAQGESVTVITGGDTLSAFEEGLADDDSWVENLSHDEEDNFSTSSLTDDSSSGEEVTLTCSAAIDHEDELRGYHRTAIDFTLHTIVEESCEESEVEQSVSRKKKRPASATDLEKYFFFQLADGTSPSANSNRDDFSETSSIYSEGVDSMTGNEDEQNNDLLDPAELASSRLEKYFLSGFMGFTAVERRDSDCSVGSDSEGRPSPEQRRKRLVRARGTGRSHSSSLDNLLSNPDLSADPSNEPQIMSEESSSDSDTNDESNSFEKSDGQFDTVKRKKGKKQKATNSSCEELKGLETTQELNENTDESDEEEDGQKTPQPEIMSSQSNLTTVKNQQSRDSGFIGSCDDLLKEQREQKSPDLKVHKNELKIDLENIKEEKKIEEKIPTLSLPPATSLTRKDSFNNWSSDEETNLMMSKMRQFFKTLVNSTQQCPTSKPTTPTLGSSRLSPKLLPPSPRAKTRSKPPQLIYFENELTRLMKTVPGIRDDQVREIVEYLSSEDTWSDSYDSSDYTSSDLEGTSSKTALQQQISDSCKQIINKFDNSVEDEEGDEGDGGIIDESNGLNKETAFVYQKLVASFEKMATGDNIDNISYSSHNSPPLIAKVMHHIGSRLVALMHEVSSGESHTSNSPKTRHYHRRLQQKISSASTTTTDDDSTSDSNLHDNFLEGGMKPYSLLPRSRSHDLLVGESRALHQSSSGVSDIAEEREASDCERFSWRGSFESALLATDSRNKLSLLGSENSASASALALAAKRRSAGDLLFSHKSISREQLDRVRSCGSIGGANSEDKLWVASATRQNRRRSSVPDASCGSGASADGEDEDEDIENRSTLPRSLHSAAATTNSLPRLPTNTSSNNMHKAQSMYHFIPQNAKSARYRPPGFNRLVTTVPKRAVSAPGLQPTHQRRNRRSQQHNVPSDDIGISEAHSSPMLASRNGNKSATPSPIAAGSRRGTGSFSNADWTNNDEDIVVLHTRSSLSSLGMRSDSMASVYSGAGEGRYGTVAVRGQIKFGLQYNYKAGALEIQVKQCKDLAPVDTKRNRSDPYVKVYLLPDKSKSGKRKTKVKKHTLNPVFDENLKFHISLNGLKTRTLWLTVWHSDMFGRNDFLGEVMMALENKVFDDPTPKWYNLQERTEPFDDNLSFKGDIIVCLQFVPPDMTVHKKGKRSRGTLHVLVKEAKSLTAVKANGTSDPFVKSYLLPEKDRSSKQKTPVAKRTVNPIWNYTFTYEDVTLQELAERCLELTVWDHDRLASNEFLGGVRFSLGTGKNYGKQVEWMDASGREMSLWKSMLERPNFWVEGCLSLRPTLDSRAS